MLLRDNIVQLEGHDLYPDHQVDTEGYLVPLLDDDKLVWCAQYLSAIPKGIRARWMVYDEWNFATREDAQDFVIKWRG